MPAASPWVAAQDAPYSHGGSAEGAMFLYGLDEVGGATGGETTASHGPGDDVQRVAQVALVEKHGQDDQASEHEGPGG